MGGLYFAVVLCCWRDVHCCNMPPVGVLDLVVTALLRVDWLLPPRPCRGWAGYCCPRPCQGWTEYCVPPTLPRVGWILLPHPCRGWVMHSLPRVSIAAAATPLPWVGPACIAVTWHLAATPLNTGELSHAARHLLAVGELCVAAPPLSWVYHTLLSFQYCSTSSLHSVVPRCPALLVDPPLQSHTHSGGVRGATMYLGPGRN